MHVCVWAKWCKKNYRGFLIQISADFVGQKGLSIPAHSDMQMICIQNDNNSFRFLAF